MEGRLMDADLTQFMEETSGLGQAIASRAREGMGGGQVGYSFGRTGSLSWAVDTRSSAGGRGVDWVRIAQPDSDVLESEEIRMIADAQDLRRRLNRVQFEPMRKLPGKTRLIRWIARSRTPPDVGVEGWHLGRDRFHWTLRDLKSDEEFGPVAEDGLGHRFSWPCGAPLKSRSSVDRTAHKK